VRMTGLGRTALLLFSNHGSHGLYPFIKVGGTVDEGGLKKLTYYVETKRSMTGVFSSSMFRARSVLIGSLESVLVLC